MKRVLGLAVSVGLFALLSACQQSGGPLKVDSVEPPQGTTAGGEEITIVGGGFQPGKTQAEVRFGRKKVETVIISSADKIKVVTPANEKGPVDVYVTFDDGTPFKIPNAFRYVEPAEGDNARRAFFGGQKAAGAKIEVDKKAQ
jgi:IPT/TIG domain